MAEARAFLDVMMLRDQKYIIAMVQLYAVRRGVSNAVALRRIVRTGLGLDPIGDENPAQSVVRRKARADLSKNVISRRHIGIPHAFRPLYDQLQRKVGAGEARRMVMIQATRATKSQE